MSLFTYDNISWNLPLMFCHDEIIFVIGDILKEFPEIQRPTLFAYGSINIPWAGGRDTHIKFFNKSFIENHLNKIIDAGLIPTFTFTKPYIKNEALNDERANWLLDYGVEHNCEFLVSADNLFNYIKDRHPEAKIAASILQGKMAFHNTNSKNQDPDYELNFYNERIDKYNRVVIRPEYAIEKLEKDLDRIKDVGKLEVHINETCLPNCPYATKCYSFMDNIAVLENKITRICGREEFEKKNNFKTSMEYSLMIKKEYIDHLIKDCGIKHLKIQGRHYPSPYLYHLVLYHLFNMDGNFQTIYPIIIDKIIKLKKSGETIPLEQQIMINQTMKSKLVNFF